MIEQLVEQIANRERPQRERKNVHIYVSEPVFRAFRRTFTKPSPSRLIEEFMRAALREVGNEQMRKEA